MNWCFAKINNRLAEIYFEKTKKEPKILGHCYVKASEYKTKKEQGYIKSDTAKFRFTYKNGKYSPIQSHKA
ncbi:hypothetical protein HYZ78_02865 [Candidatus Microgenomates bacterium]|nr:hypothetical protein [Candidatus Microgenomates bacterium]